MHLLCHIYLYLNTWCISVEEEAGGMNLTRMKVIHFEMDRHTYSLNAGLLCMEPGRGTAMGWERRCF